MTTKYTIVFTDINKPPFDIQAFTANGPIIPSNPTPVDVAANTTLQLYGKSYPEYGRGVFQDLVYLLENFANSTKPEISIEGQLWYKNDTTELFIRNNVGNGDDLANDWDGVILTNGVSVMTGELTLSSGNPAGLLSAIPKQLFDGHTTDQTLHLTSNQNTFLDGLLLGTDDATELQSDDVNQLIGISGNVQIQLDGKFGFNGGTMDSGADLTFNGGQVLGLPPIPLNDSAAASKKYVDDQASAVTSDQQTFLTALNLPIVTGNDVNFLIGVTTDVEPNINSRLSRNGDSMAIGQSLTFTGGEVLGLLDAPTVPNAAASGKYVVDQIALIQPSIDSKVSKDVDSNMGLNVNTTFDGTGEVLGLPNTPSQPGSATSKFYVDAKGGERMRWRNNWADVAYFTNDVVRDGEWTMVANTDMSVPDRAAPQEIGQAVDGIPNGTILGQASHTSVIRMKHSYTFTKSGKINSLRIHVPFWNLDTVSRVTISNPVTGEAVVYNNPILKSDNWVTITASGLLVTAGTIIDVVFEYYNSTTASNVTGNWKSNLGTGSPADKEFNIDDLNIPTVIEIDHTDLNTTNRQVELVGVGVGSIIYITETNDANRNVEVKVTAVDTTSGTSTKYTVVLIANGNKDIRDNKTCTIRIDVPVTQSLYTVITNYWQTPAPFATVISSLQYDGVPQPVGTPDVDDAYGIDINFQEMSLSPDWDMLALSSSAGSGNYNSDTSYQIDVTILVGGVTETKLPIGWTAASTGVGNLTITHNLSTDLPGFGLMVMTAGTINLSAITIDDITFEIVDSAGTAADGTIIGRLTF